MMVPLTEKINGLMNRFIALLSLGLMSSGVASEPLAKTAFDGHDINAITFSNFNGSKTKPLCSAMNHPIFIFQ